jgi:hypothetical protein
MLEKIFFLIRMKKNKREDVEPLTTRRKKCREQRLEMF